MLFGFDYLELASYIVLAVSIAVTALVAWSVFYENR